MLKLKKEQVLISFIVVIFICAMTLQAGSADKKDSQWWKVGFETPVPFSAPQKAGLDAVVLVHPPESGLGKGQMEITLVAVSKDMQVSMGNEDAQILNYVKATFLGSATPATKSVPRSFLGRKVVGEAQSSSIPKPVELQLYLVPLSDGDKVAVGFKTDVSMLKEKAENVIKTVAETFKEIKK